MRAVFCVTNDLNTDQRMIRICGTLQSNGWDVELIGREKRESASLLKRSYKQTRLKCWFEKGKLFYLEYNLRLFWYLLRLRMNVLCVIDLDTAIPGILLKSLRQNLTLVYDAHEIFPMVPEVQNRKAVQTFWLWVEGRIFRHADRVYTVGNALAEYFQKLYSKPVEVIRNMPVKQNDSAHTHSEIQNELTGNMPVKQISHPPQKSEKIESQSGWEIAEPQIPFEDGSFILYQGALNQGRGLERLLSILTRVNYPLLIVGKGDIEIQLKEFVQQNGMQNQVHFYGFVRPNELPKITRKARIGYNVSENEGLSYYLSLNNKFFDYVEAGLPSVINDFPEYLHLNREFGVGLNVSLDNAEIEEKLTILMENDQVYQKCVENCRKAREIWNWENESKSLVAFYQSLLNND